MNKQAYEQGFIDTCKAYNVDPQALVKWAQESSKNYDPIILAKRIYGKYFNKKLVPPGPIKGTLGMVETVPPPLVSAVDALGTIDNIANRVTRMPFSLRNTMLAPPLWNALKAGKWLTSNSGKISNFTKSFGSRFKKLLGSKVNNYNKTMSLRLL